MPEQGIAFTDQGISIHPRIVQKPAITVAGYAFNPEEVGWDHVPTAFYVLCRKLPAFVRGERANAVYGVIYNAADNSRPPDVYLAGIEVASAEGLPPGTAVRHIPPTTFAVFTIRGSLGKMGAAYGYIDACWLKGNRAWEPDLDAATKPIEVYDERFVPGPTAEFEIWTPVRRRA